MKISMFHLMPYRFLPPDFEDRYRSVWVDVPHELYDARKAGELYNEFLDELLPSTMIAARDVRRVSAAAMRFGEGMRP